MSSLFPAGTTLGAPLLRPLIALNLWTFTMEAWMYATRLPAISKYHVPTTPHATKDEFNAKIPRPVQWKADNYNHLLEQPTQFYGVVLAGVAAGLGADEWAAGLAWGYVGVRVAHSLVQATVNKVQLRFGLFAISSLVLLGLTGRVGMALF